MNSEYSGSFVDVNFAHDPVCMSVGVSAYHSVFIIGHWTSRGERKFGNCGDNLVCQLDKETQESTCTCTQVKVIKIVDELERGPLTQKSRFFYA